MMGMHRSGTSLLAGSLEAAGLYLGDVNNRARHNQKGNKENESIRALNNTLLTMAGSSWHSPPACQIRWSPSSLEEGQALVERYGATGRSWGFKDPRTIWTVEGWLRLLPHTRIIAVFRHPSLVVRSLAARPGHPAIDETSGLRIWCAYNTELLRLQEKHDFPILHCNPQSLHDDFLAPLSSFASSIHLPKPVDSFLDESLLHHTVPQPIMDEEGNAIFAQLTAASQHSDIPSVPRMVR